MCAFAFSYRAVQAAVGRGTSPRRLSRELVGHAAVGHLRLNVNDIVQTDQIVLEGVEASEASVLGGALERAVDAANRASTSGALNPTPNVAQEGADGIAQTIEVHQS